jgi:hypothetical protein
MNEGACIAQTLERILRETLAQLEGLPDELLNRPLEQPETNTLFALATHIIGAAEYWVLALVGAHPLARERAAEFHTYGSLAELKERYERYIDAMHELLDVLPATRLEEPVAPPGAYRYVPPERPLLVRDALLHALEHSALHLGHIQLTRQLLGPLTKQ